MELFEFNAGTTPLLVSMPHCGTHVPDHIARPAEMASAILYLASDMASFVTGAIHVADGGVTGKA